jgi:hypothetical protein
MHWTTRTARPRPSAGFAAALLASLALAVAPSVAPERDVAAAGPRPIAAIVVGPVGSSTSAYRLEARRMADQLRGYGAIVRQVYSPWATWTRVKDAARGANLFIYLGQGRGNPGPYGAFDPRTMNGLGLNRTAGDGHRNVASYGEFYVRRDLDLARDAVVILNRVPYAAGGTATGSIAQRTAMLRADNYAAGFLAAGAAAVFAGDRSVTTVIRDLFKSRRTMRSMFWNSPWTSTRYDEGFGSWRTPGASGIVAPYSPGSYHQAVVGRLAWMTTAWRQSWTAPVASVSGSSVRVTSIPALMSALADDEVTEIVVANGTYAINTAGSKTSTSLWIGSRFAGRTHPVVVRAETVGQVVFDGGGRSHFGGISFEDGAHHQTWDGFVFVNGTPTLTGVITFGGYTGQPAAHHITLRNITLEASLTSTSEGSTDHGVYFSEAVGGPHDVLIDRLTVRGAGGLDSALHFYGSSTGNPNAWNVTIRRLTVTGTQQAVMLWDRTLHDITIDTATISDAGSVAIRFESPGATGITLANITSTGSGYGAGFLSTLGLSPPGVTFINTSLN